MAILYESKFNVDIKRLRDKDETRYRVIDEMLDRIDNKDNTKKRINKKEEERKYISD